MGKRNVLKRACDVLVSGLLLLVSLPIQLVLASLVRADSPGPIFYRATRVGRAGREFTLYKFRSMVTHAADLGPAIATPGDKRVTRVGWFLRRTRLDELPQLWNIVRGDMSLVGPRPEDPRFVALYTPDQQRVLSIRRGLTGLSQLHFLDEQRLLASADPQQTYIRDILPRKLAIDLTYVESNSLGQDLRILGRTTQAFAGMLLPGGGFMQVLLRQRRALIVLTNVALVVLANYLAFALRFDGANPSSALTLMLVGLPALIVVRLLVFHALRLHEGLWRYTGVWDLRTLALAVLLSSGAFAAAVEWIVPIRGYPRSIYITDGLLVFTFLGGMRLVGRLYREAATDQDARRALIVGAGDSGATLVHEMKHQSDFNAVPVGFVDDDPGKRGLYIHGVRVLGSRADLPRIVDRIHPDELIVALPHVDNSVLRGVVTSLESFPGPIRILPSFGRLLGERGPLDMVRPLSIGDLLPRPPVGLDPRIVRDFIAGRRVLVTGAGGSIGAELCRQIASSTAPIC